MIRLGSTHGDKTIVNKENPMKRASLKPGSAIGSRASWSRLAVLGALAALGLLLFTGSASAAPTFGVELTRTPTTINRGDEFVSYEVKVKNTSATDPTTGPLNVVISLPTGFTLVKTNTGSGGWACDLTSNTCSNSKIIGPESSYPALQLSQIWIDTSAPAVPTTTVTVVGAGGKTVITKDTFTFGPETPFGLALLEPSVVNEAGEDYVQAGGHPYQASAIFKANTHTVTLGAGMETVVEQFRSVFSELPAGFIGNPFAVETCPVSIMLQRKCPDSAAVGGILLELQFTPEFISIEPAVVYSIPAEKGYPAEFGFVTDSPKLVVRVKVRTDSDYGINVQGPLTPQVPILRGGDFTFCGYGVNTVPTGFNQFPGFNGCKKVSEAAPIAKPVTTMPTNCKDEQVFKFAIESWEKPGLRLANGSPNYSDPNWKQYQYTQPSLTGCNKLVEAWTNPETGPTLEFQPSVTNADSPAGYTARVHVNNQGLNEIKGLSASHLRNIKVVLPKGVTLNPSVGDGVQTCSEEEMGRLPGPGVHFNLQVPDCPSTSKLGLVRIDTPLLENPVKGAIYLARQHENPFGTDFAVYLVVEEPDSGIVIKLPGEVTVNEETGQITSIFRENPQLPFENLTVSFFGGPVAALANPGYCSKSFSTNSELTPWAAANPYEPQQSEIAHFADPLSIETAPATTSVGEGCPTSAASRPFNISFDSGVDNTEAGAQSPFNMHVTRPDGSQEIEKLELVSPPGFSASLKGIPTCSTAQIAAAKKNSGVAEEAHPSCPASSQIGTLYAGAGAGSRPLYNNGNVYMSGPYKGAPLSIVTIVPGIAGGTPGHPAFDLGNVVVRSALYINRQTAQVTAVTDPIPQYLKGIGLRIRDIRIHLDRRDFTRNPTNCESKSVDLRIFGNSGAVKNLSSHFQVGGCDKLKFKPKFSAHLTGGTKRGDHPAFTAEVNYPEGGAYANTSEVAVTLPHSDFLDQAHINTVCTRVQVAADACPPGSIYGEAEATSPLLDGKLTGPVFLKSSDNQLPDLAIALKGPENEPVEVEFQGHIDSVHGRIRDTIEGLPDVPVTQFVLRMKGGKKGLLVNSRDLCKSRKVRMDVRMLGQNNTPANQTPLLTNDCSKKHKAKKTKKSRQKAKHTTVAERAATISWVRGIF